MRNVLKYFLVITFLFLSSIHFYWATGGTLGYLSSLPTNENGSILLAPTIFDCIIVATILFVFTLIYTFSIKDRKSKIFNSLIKLGQWVIPILFLIRAVGDFKYVGFFKQVTTTEFSRMDSYFFTPLCLLISFVGIIILYNSLRKESK